MFDLDQVPVTLRPTQACTSEPNARVDDLCTEAMQRYRPLAESIGNSQFTSRYAKAVTSLAPFLAENLDLANLRVLEIGSGHGAKSLALAPFVKSYVGLEIAPGLVNFAEGARKKLGVDNVRFELDEAANIADFLGAQTERFDLILLYAVLEHLTVEEKLTLMSECWKHLGDDGHLFIGETPNRMLPVDLHSSQLVYFQQAPLDIWKRSFDDAGNRDWAHAMQTSADADKFEHGAYRRGLHLGHQEFDLGLMRIEELANHVVDDGFNAHIMNLYFYLPVEFLKLVEFGLLDEYENMAHVVSRRFPAFFSRYFLEVLLSKTKAAPRAPTVVHASIGDQTRIVSGSRLTPEVIAPRKSARWALPTDSAQPPRSVVIGFYDPASVGQITISADRHQIAELDVNKNVALLRPGRQELVYSVTLPAGTSAQHLTIKNRGKTPCPIRYVAFR